MQDLQGNVLNQKKRLMSTLSKIKKKIVNRITDTILRLHKCIARLQLEYYIQVAIARNRTWRNRKKCEQELDVFNVTEYLYIYSEALCFGLPKL